MLTDEMINQAINNVRNEQGGYDVNDVRANIQSTLIANGAPESEAEFVAYDWLNAEQQTQAELDEQESRNAAYERLREEGW